MTFTWISQSISQLTTVYAPLFLVEAHSWLKWIGIIILAVYALKWGLVSVSGHGGYDLPGVVQFFVMFSLAAFMLTHYDSPLPGTSSTVASIIPDTADKLSEVMNNQALKNTVGKFKKVLDNIDDPPSLIVNTTAWITWAEVTIMLYMVEAFMFLVNILGYLALGVLTMLGPLTIPFFIVPRLSWIFWSWLSAVIEFAFWRVVSTAIVLVWATAWGLFIDNSIAGNYTLPHLAELTPYMTALSLATILSVVYLPAKLTSDLFKGTATAGANWATATAVAIRALV